MLISCTKSYITFCAFILTNEVVLDIIKYIKSYIIKYTITQGGNHEDSDDKLRKRWRW